MADGANTPLHSDAGTALPRYVDGALVVGVETPEQALTEILRLVDVTVMPREIEVSFGGQSVHLLTKSRCVFGIRGDRDTFGPASGAHQTLQNLLRGTGPLALRYLPADGGAFANSAYGLRVDQIVPSSTQPVEGGANSLLAAVQHTLGPEFIAGMDSGTAELAGAPVAAAELARAVAAKWGPVAAVCSQSGPELVILDGRLSNQRQFVSMHLGDAHVFLAVTPQSVGLVVGLWKDLIAD